jgi:acetyl-CoA C-acetyltransferase
VTPSAENRPLSFPYTKLQVANSAVNQGAAVIVTSLATAREAGIDEARLVYVGAGAQAYEAEGPLGARQLHRHPGDGRKPREGA